MTSLSVLGWRLPGPVLTFAVCAGLCAFFPAGKRSWSTPQLERQLELALAASDYASVRELARRLARLDGSVARQLQLAEAFLPLGADADFERALAAVERASPRRLRAVDRLRARAASLHGRWPEAVARWEEFLRAPGDLNESEHTTALDELIAAQLEQRNWPAALTRIDERLARADELEPRLLRATTLIPARDWSAAAEAFALLRRTAAGDARVKSLLPRWERVERSRAELVSADAAVAAAPSVAAPRLDRAELEMRCGLWRNAAEDLMEATTLAPTARLPGLLRTRLGKGDEPLPLLAASDARVALVTHLDGQRALWQALRKCEAAIAVSSDRVAIVPLLVEQARLISELGFPGQALDDARAILREAPHTLAAERVELAALIALQRWVDADAAATVAIQHHTGADGAVDLELGRLAAFAWQAQGRHGDAVRLFSTCLQVHRTPEILRARAKSLRYLQRFAEARDDLIAADASEVVGSNQTP